MTYGERTQTTRQSPAHHRGWGILGYSRSLLSRFVDETLDGDSLRQGRYRQLERTAPLLFVVRRKLLALLLQNLSNKEIAKELDISARTAKFHVSNLLAKHGVRTKGRLDPVLDSTHATEGQPGSYSEP